MTEVPPTIVDWNLAERVALALAGSGSGSGWSGSEDQLRSESGRAATLVRHYTGLKPRGRLPAAELVDRSEWARVNIESFRGLAAKVERELQERSEERGKNGGLQRTLVSAATGAEVGLAVGYLSQRVIGQYDVPLIGPARAPRLLFVGPNLASARRRLDVDRDLFLRWVALHETTHAVHFAAVPWLRDHIGALAEELFEKAAIEVKPGELIGKLVRLNPKELIRSATSGELATLLWPEPQRRLLAQLTATMTIVEGYAEHVMDAVGEELDPRYADLRRALDRDRDRRGLLDSIVSRLLGLEMKLAQYRRGKAFADEVVSAHGIRTLNRAWHDPEALPRPAELDSPTEWVERVGAARERRFRALWGRSRRSHVAG